MMEDDGEDGDDGMLKKREQLSESSNSLNNMSQKNLEDSNQLSKGESLPPSNIDLQRLAMSSRRWAQKWIRIPNIWEHAPDLWVLKWVKGSFCLCADIHS
jgi:hypothetical protein